MISSSRIDDIVPMIEEWRSGRDDIINMIISVYWSDEKRIFSIGNIIRVVSIFYIPRIGNIGSSRIGTHEIITIFR